MAGWTTYQNSMPTFVVDHNSITRGTGVQIDWSAVPDSFLTGTAYTITLTADADAAAEELTVAALTVDLPLGTTLNFTGAGKFAILTAAAVVGDTTLAVEALPEALDDEDEATYRVSNARVKSIPAGTIMAALASGKVVPRSESGAATATCLLASNAIEGQPYNALTGWGNLLGGVVYDNLLPDYGHADLATWKGELQAAGVGTGFSFRTYADDRS